MPAPGRICFVATARGNYHMRELLDGLAAAAVDAGLPAELCADGYPDGRDDDVYVVIPHELYATEKPDRWPRRAQLARTIGLCVENPGTQWFHELARVSGNFPRLLAINHSSVTGLKRLGIASEHVQLGYTRHWDMWRGRESARSVDVAYLGSEDERRDQLLSGYSRWLWRRRQALLVPSVAAKPHARSDYLVDADKYALLRDSALLINLHRKGSHSFEWVRALQAIANGCVVASEPSLDDAPLVAGEHLVVADAASLPHVADRLLDAPEELERIRRAAYDFVRTELTMEPAVELIAATAEDVLASASRWPATGPPRPAEEPEPAPPGFDENVRMRSAVRGLATEALELRRMIAGLAQRLDGHEPDGEPEQIATTPAYRGAAPRVTVAVTLFNYEREVKEALASLAVSEYEDFEVVVLDDASSDTSLQSVRDFMVDHPWMPIALLHNRVNRGLGASRNAIMRHARGELLFVLDADNAVYPRALGRLVEALDGDPEAAFAYPLLAVTRGGEPAGLLSRYGWDPDGFRDGNYIDAMAMMRVEDLLELGGYTEDVRLTSWEDYHLWCRCAESGRRGVLVPELLARYRKTGHSMLSWTQTDTATAVSLLHERFPAIVAPLPGA